MANAGPGTNGSQFFLVYKDSKLPPNYTVFGKIDDTGLATLDKIAAAGVAGGGQDGKPQARRPGQVDRAGLTQRDDARCRRRRTALTRRRTTRTAIRGRAPTNGLAIASLICAFLFAPLGIIFGHISLSQIKRTGEDGHGLAVAGLVISYLITVGTILALVAVTLLAVLLARNVQTSLDDMNRHPGITAAPDTGQRAAGVRSAAQPRRQLRLSGHHRAGQQAQQAAAVRQGADRPGSGQRELGHQSGQHRPAARQRQGALHRQQFRQPGPAGLLRRHDVSPVDHHADAGCAAVRRPDRARGRADPATGSPTSTPPTSTGSPIRR